MSSFYRRKYRSIEISVGPAYWPAFGWTALLAFLQTVLVPLLVFRGAVPSLVTIAVVLYASRAGSRRGAMLALPAGVREAVFAGTAGGWTISTTIVALLVGLVSRRMFADGAFVPAVLCGLAVLARDLMFWSIMRIEGFPPGFAVAHLHTSLWRALLTALVAFGWLVLRGRLVTDKTTIERYGYT
jgi:rod shape-determining protein MreD